MSEIKVNKISPKQTCTTVTLGDSGDDFVVASGVNFKTAEVKDAAGNVIISRCGSNITIGSCGAAVSLACGATQSGFGRSGSVNWDTTAKTAGFTAVSGNGYFVNTTSGAITVTLPATPSAGDIVSISDYAGTSISNNITVGRNGSNIEGNASDLTIANDGISLTFVYVDGTKGWKVVGAGQESNKDPSVAAYVTATGGTITCCGDYKIHTFTGPGTFTVTCAGNLLGSNTVDYLVIAGGGGGNQDSSNPNGGGGGGAGGYRESSGAASGCYSASPLGACVSALPVSAQGYPITVGAGGTSTSSIQPNQPTSSGQGNNSIFSTITSAGGGVGGYYNGAPGANGGSGGGGGANAGAGGTGNTPPVSPPQGNNGSGATPGQPGAGGGAGSAGSGSTGGNGTPSTINGTPTTRAGGGGGGQPGNSGGPGGGGGYRTSGTANTGSGGGGSNNGGTTGAGGSGIVIIRYKYQ